MRKKCNYFLMHLSINTLAMILLLRCGPISCFGQTWTLTGTPTNFNWSCIAGSADGTKLVAANHDGTINGTNGVWVSTNSGATWSLTGAPITNDWWAVASSADGSQLAATDAYYGLIYTSADSGTTWTQANLPIWTWRSIAMSADGAKLVVSAGNPAFNQYIFTSEDAGVTWVSHSVPGMFAVFVASSADGNSLVAAANTGYILTSTNAGATWQSVLSGLTFGFYSVASSSSGSTLMAGGEDYILVSTNSGATWNSNNFSALVGPGTVGSCASSADGDTLVAVVTSANLDLKGAGIILISTNSGAAWTQANAPIEEWSGVTASADGCQLAGSAYNDPFTPFPTAWYGGGVYTSKSTPAPYMNIMQQKSNLTLSWTVPSMNFVIQQSPNLVGWTDMTNLPVLNPANLQDEVLAPLPSSKEFYRLTAF